MAEKWKVDPPKGACIKTEEGEPIGFMNNPQRATQVIREHNSHEALVDGCRRHKQIFIGDYGNTAWDANYSYIEAALALAEEA